ncbi:hypothetical protein [Gordonia zhaorongruii]|uniref:hypothetical protein n=1 Tax=Gordonia zhaorongruii TaxID=2597659 RepID=UPI001FD062CB|nr:hypothetical protein [Gordonia zhaorongruii]
MIAAVVAATVATGCSVDGAAERVPDLNAKAVDSSAFPFGPATQVPPAQLPGAIADVTFLPLRARNEPDECTPSPVSAEGAALRVGPGGLAGGTLSVLVARASGGFHEYVDRLRSCPDFLLGGTVGTHVTTQIIDSGKAIEAGDGAVQSDRTLRNGETAYAYVYELVAQQGDVRVVVQNRRPGRELGAPDRSATRELFDAATTRAFGG